MLIAALVLTIVAMAVFFIDFARSSWATLTSLGLGLLAAGISVYFIYLLEETGKL